MSLTGFIIGWCLKIIIVIGVLLWLDAKIYKEAKVHVLREIYLALCACMRWIGRFIRWIKSCQKSVPIAETRPTTSENSVVRVVVPGSRNMR